MLGTAPTILGTTPTMLDAPPTVLGTTPAMPGTTLSMGGATPYHARYHSDHAGQYPYDAAPWTSRTGCNCPPPDPWSRWPCCHGPHPRAPRRPHCPPSVRVPSRQFRVLGLHSATRGLHGHTSPQPERRKGGGPSPLIRAQIFRLGSGSAFGISDFEMNVC